MEGDRGRDDGEGMEEGFGSCGMKRAREREMYHCGKRSRAFRWEAWS